MRKKIVFLFVLLTLTFWHLLEVKAIDLTNSNDQYSFHKNTFIFCDQTSSRTIHDISSKTYHDSFKLLEQGNRIMDNTNATYWVKFIILAKSEDKNWLLEFFDFRIANLTLFNEKKEIVTTYSHYQAFKKRAFPHKNFTYPLPLKKNEPIILYAKIQIDKDSYIAGLIRTYENFSSYAYEEYFLLALFYGTLLTLILYNFLLFFSIRDNAYIYYGLYITFIVLLMSSRDGIGFQFIWQNYPSINKYIFPIAESAIIFFVCQYAISFLELKKNDPLLYKIIHIAFIVRMIIFFGLWSIDNRYIYSYNYDLAILIVISIAGIRAKIKGFNPALYYIAGFSFVLLGFLLNILIDNNSIPANAFTFYSLNIGILIESFFLSLALGSKLQSINKEKKESQAIAIEQLKVNEALSQKVNLELEEKVRTRTLELNEKTEALLSSNIKLQELTNQLHELNSSLDRDNWKLNQDLKEKTKDQITSSELTYEQFSNVFPDELSCFRYLEEIKWKNGFVCKKCGHSKFSLGIIKFSRKCTRCDYIETIKSNTIFTGVKFPLQKSFYILYVLTNIKRKVTLRELSHTLALRISTCSDFRKKVESKKEKRKIERWEELVLDN